MNISAACAEVIEQAVQESLEFFCELYPGNGGPDPELVECIAMAVAAALVDFDDPAPPA